MAWMSSCMPYGAVGADWLGQRSHGHRIRTGGDNRPARRLARQHDRHSGDRGSRRRRWSGRGPEQLQLPQLQHHQLAFQRARRDFGWRHHQLAHHAAQRERHRGRRAFQPQEHRCAGGRLLISTLPSMAPTPLRWWMYRRSATRRPAPPFRTGSLNNSFALIVYSSCSFDTAAANAQNAGAVGFILHSARRNGRCPIRHYLRAIGHQRIRSIGFDLQQRRPEPEELHRCEPQPAGHD
jgi:hypothetical protein